MLRRTAAVAVLSSVVGCAANVESDSSMTDARVESSADAGSMVDVVEPVMDSTVVRDAMRSDDAIASDAGRSAFEQLLDTVAVGSWKALPSSAMRGACPTPLNTYRCDSVQSAWSGAAYDDRRDRLLVFGGGHGDSFYNQIFAFDLRSMQWTRLTEMPADATPSTASAAMQYVPIESCGYYPTSVPSIAMADLAGGYVRTELCARADIAALLDRQQPRSSHTYGKLFYDNARDRFCYLGGGYYPSAQAMSRYGFCYDFASRRWEQTVDRPASLNGRGTIATDARGHQWYLSDDSGPIGEFAPETRMWSTFGSVNYDARGTSDVDRRRNHLWLLRDASTMGAALFRYDLDDRARLAMSRGSPEMVDAMGPSVPARGTRVGFVYADAHDRFLFWNGGRAVFSFDPSARTWAALAATGDDPGPALANGTYGRLRYSATFNALVLANGADKPVFVYRLPASL